MTLKTWSAFSKRINSTKQPTSGSDLVVVLKEKTSIVNPVFLCDSVGTNVNYVYSADWGRYYFVTNAIQVTKDQVELHCSVDVLASAKSNIQSTSCFVEYAASSSDLTQNDPRNRPTDIIAHSNETLTWNSNPFTDAGCYIAGVLTDQADGSGGVLTYYAMTQAQIGVAGANITDQSFWQTIQDKFTGVDTALSSLIWVPISTGSISGTSTTFSIGGTAVPNVGSVKRISDRIVSFNAASNAMSFPSGSGAGSSMVYIDKAPYSTGELFLPFVGVVPLDLDIAAETKNLQIFGDIDILTGDIVYRVGYGGAMVATFNGNCATKMPISNATYDAIGAATGAIGVIGGVAGAIIAGVTGGAASAIVGAVGAAGASAWAGAKSLELHTMINGSASSAVGARLGKSAWYRIYTYVPTTGATNADLLSFKASHGMPYNKVATLSSLSGYIKCSGASVNCPFTNAEKNEINGYLNGGFYYE